MHNLGCFPFRLELLHFRYPEQVSEAISYNMWLKLDRRKFKFEFELKDGTRFFLFILRSLFAYYLVVHENIEKTCEYCIFTIALTCFIGKV